MALDWVTKRHDAQVGIYAFGQHDNETATLDGFAQQHIASGQLEAFYLGDQYKPASWLTLTGGVRLTHFAGAVVENAADPRLGAAVRIPHLGWTLRGFWGRYYQAPPLSTLSGELLLYAQAQGLGFIPLHGERDREVQLGLTVPLRGWSVELNRYNQRATNYFDHNSIGDSNVFFPLTIAGARLRGWELAVRSPRLWHRGEIYASYALARAEGEGAVTGGLTDFSPPPDGYFLLDHDQRHTLHAGFNFHLPGRLLAGANWYYGSGFTDGSSDLPAHLEGHNTVDVSFGRTFGEAFTVSVTGLNVGNRRFLLDNSATFGGTHYADPRQVYVQVRYRFKL
jgi:outer membrane receptor protein involved in Fe transport